MKRTIVDKILALCVLLLAGFFWACKFLCPIVIVVALFKYIAG